MKQFWLATATHSCCRRAAKKDIPRHPRTRDWVDLSQVAIPKTLHPQRLLLAAQEQARTMWVQPLRSKQCSHLGLRPVGQELLSWLSSRFISFATLALLHTRSVAALFKLLPLWFDCPKWTIASPCSRIGRMMRFVFGRSDRPNYLSHFHISQSRSESRLTTYEWRLKLKS